MLIGPGGGGVKLGWNRIRDGNLNSGLQVTGIRFPGAGCYEVSGSVPGGPPLRFVTRVAQR